MIWAKVMSRYMAINVKKGLVLTIQDLFYHHQLKKNLWHISPKLGMFYTMDVTSKMIPHISFNNKHYKIEIDEMQAASVFH
jgi:hypothetical protein